MHHRIVSNLLGLVGAVLGGALGYAAFFWIEKQGFYALILPGALLGLGCGLLARHRSWPRGVACGLAAVALGLYTEWQFRPFNADGSFRYLVTHFHSLQPITLIMIGVGGLLAFWMGSDHDFGRRDGGEGKGPPSDPLS
jgi:hypothetical protein